MSAAGQVTREALWVGPAFKLESAFFHYGKMMRVAAPMEYDAYMAAIASTGAIIDSGWQRAIWPHFDAFLMTLRSVPEIVRCCFGKDLGHRTMQVWWDALPAEEQRRRSDFTLQYETAYQTFRDLSMSQARHVTEHRTGLPDVEVTIIGGLGVAYVGGPGRAVPISETPELPNPSLQWMAKARPLEPHFNNFTIGGKPLFAECQAYLQEAQSLIKTARKVAEKVHGAALLTVPPA